MTESVPVRFARLATGARIAYASAGQGPPLVMVPGWLCHLRESWSHPSAASARDKLAAAHTFLWYDRLGCGLSDRDGFELSLDNDVEQLVAVLDAAGVKRADLIGYSFGAPPAAAFAARFPERVNRLIFYSAFARLKGHTTAERMDGLKQIVRMDWALGSLALACRLLPNASSQDLRWFSRFQRSAATSEMAARLLDHMWHLDVRDVLPELRCPVLVIHNRHDPAIPLRTGREIAALVPGAGVHILDGNEHDPFIRDSGAVVEAILDFAAGHPPTPRAAGPPAPAELTAREREVLRLIAHGRANKEIATALGIRIATVERHVTNTYRKLGARGRADAVMCAVAMDLVAPGGGRTTG